MREEGFSCLRLYKSWNEKRLYIKRATLLNKRPHKILVYNLFYKSFDLLCGTLRNILTSDNTLDYTIVSNS